MVTLTLNTPPLPPPIPPELQFPPKEQPDELARTPSTLSL